MNRDKQVEKMLRVAVCSTCYDNVDRSICSGHRESCSARDEKRYMIENLVNAGYGDVKQAQIEILNKVLNQLAEEEKCYTAEMVEYHNKGDEELRHNRALMSSVIYHCIQVIEKYIKELKSE